jgi:hypothetical protein
VLFRSQEADFALETRIHRSTYGPPQAVRAVSGVYWTSDAELRVPDYDNLRHDCVDAFHSHPYAGHYGVRRTHHLLSRTFYMPGMLATVKHFVQHCDLRQRSKAPRQRVSGPLHPLAIPHRRWHSVSLDLITDLLITPRGFDTIVVFVDRLSNMVHIEAATKSITGESPAELFERRVIRYHGVPHTLISDRDVGFRSVFGAGPWKSAA